MQVLIVLQMIGLVVAASIAGMEIESIVGSGPMVALVGFAIAAWAYRTNRPLGLAFGLGAPTLAVLCFCLIFGYELSPNQAAQPIGLLIVFAGLALVALGTLTIREIRIAERRLRARVPFQFSVRALLVLTFVCAVVFRLATVGNTGGTAVAIGAAYTAALVFIVRRFQAGSQGLQPLGLEENLVAAQAARV